MTALDFMMGCIGMGVLLVCGAWSVKILGDTRTRVKAAKDMVQRKEEPLDPMGQRLQELRGARFGRPMAPPEALPPRAPPQTWPVTGTKPASPPLPDDKRKKGKDVVKKQGGK